MTSEIKAEINRFLEQCNERQLSLLNMGELEALKDMGKLEALSLAFEYGRAKGARCVRKGSTA